LHDSWVLPARLHSRVSVTAADEDAEEIATPTRRFSLLEIASGLPDDSREADERAAERRLRELRGRVEAARAAISTAPGAELVLRQDWVKAAQFYARFEITEDQFGHGVPRGESSRAFPSEIGWGGRILAMLAMRACYHFDPHLCLLQLTKGRCAEARVQFGIEETLHA
jgi:hypothetical protein